MTIEKFLKKYQNAEIYLNGNYLFFGEGRFKINEWSGKTIASNKDFKKILRLFLRKKKIK